MPIKPKPGHFYERRDKQIVQYNCPNCYVTKGTHPHIVGGHQYTDEGYYFGEQQRAYLSTPDGADLMKDLGTIDPRKKDKVLMHFYRDSDGDLCGTVLQGYAEDHHHASHGLAFSQDITVPKITKVF